MLLEPIKTGKTGQKSQYYAVRQADGRMTCSCGRSLEKLDEQTYKCSAGYPMYRFEDGTIIKDKFGNLLFKEQDHDQEGKFNE